ncbi:MAG: DUF2075 domain-containing protein [Opitutales bacterium]|nr:DUF2075 domain-containing protein [Opitutales bacterium]
MPLPYFYSDSISEFISKSLPTILGELSQRNTFSLSIEQRNAWTKEIELLQNILRPYPGRGSIFFEYNIPRMGRRIDVVLLIQGVIFILEFKVGEHEFTKADLAQTWDYALDLKNFHRGSHTLSIFPILVATNVNRGNVANDFIPYDDKVFVPICATEETLAETIHNALSIADKIENFDSLAWATSSYAPTPTIIEAASALYNSHSVVEISRSEGSAKNLTETCSAISEIIQDCEANHKKAICFVTGVPGAGKTLVGLNIATQQFSKKKPAVYLSGNGPLVEVLTEALARDKILREKARVRAEKSAGNPNPQKAQTKKEAISEVKAFIQLVHHYRSAYLLGAKIQNGEIVADEAYFQNERNRDKNFVPVDHVAIFDEAQRAWTKEALVNFMSRKKGIPNFPCSEPAFLISCLDRHKDWAVIVCLVGGGQEINTGEAGIAEWISALNEYFPNWNVYISNHLGEREYASGDALDLLANHQGVTVKDELHLAVSMRSFRAENLSNFVHALLDFEKEKARELYEVLKAKYPIVLTRDLSKAKKWLRERARGSERYGMLVSSKANRLKPLSIDIRCKPDVVCWFLNEESDVRSSNFLEDAVSEFDVQGLEVDWACVVWDADLRCIRSQAWEHFQFNGGCKWNRINKEERRAYQKNAYRVLLTRARQGMVICVPAGDPEDATRRPAFYDSTYAYLRSLGLPEL